jgi:hypothetical protein
VSASRGDPRLLERAIRTEVQKLNPAMALDFELASDVVGATLRRQELGMTLMLIFGGIAIVLAAVGIYGVVSYAGSLRRDEMATPGWIDSGCGRGWSVRFQRWLCGLGGAGSVEADLCGMLILQLGRPA